MNKDYLDANLEVLSKLNCLNRIYKEVLLEIINCLKKGNKILFMGNGGSASDSNHIVGEFIAKFKIERESLPAISLTTNEAIITAVSNDSSFDYVFSRQIESLGKENDIVIGLSTSGKSINIINGLNKAKEKNLKTILITGNTIIKDYDYTINIPSNETSIIQNMYMIILHMICMDVERYFYENRN